MDVGTPGKTLAVVCLSFGGTPGKEVKKFEHVFRRQVMIGKDRAGKGLCITLRGICFEWRTGARECSRALGRHRVPQAFSLVLGLGAFMPWVLLATP